MARATFPGSFGAASRNFTNLLIQNFKIFELISKNVNIYLFNCFIVICSGYVNNFVDCIRLPRFPFKED